MQRDMLLLGLRKGRAFPVQHRLCVFTGLYHTLGSLQQPQHLSSLPHLKLPPCAQQTLGLQRAPFRCTRAGCRLVAAPSLQPGSSLCASLCAHRACTAHAAAVMPLGCLRGAQALASTSRSSRAPSLRALLLPCCRSSAPAARTERQPYVIQSPGINRS